MPWNSACSNPPKVLFHFFLYCHLLFAVLCHVVYFLSVARRTVFIYPFARQTHNYYIFQWTAKLNFQSVQNPAFICLFTGYRSWILMSIHYKNKPTNKTKQGRGTQESGNCYLVCYCEVIVNLLIKKEAHAWKDKDQLQQIGQLNKIRNSIYKFILDFNRIRKNTFADSNQCGVQGNILIDSTQWEIQESISTFGSNSSRKQKITWCLYFGFPTKTVGYDRSQWSTV